MSQVSNDIASVKTLVNHIGPPNKAFGRILGETTGFRLRMSQQSNNSQFRNGVDENISNQFPRFSSLSNSLLQRRLAEESRKNEEKRIFPSRAINSGISSFHSDYGCRTNSSTVSRRFGFVSDDMNPSTSGMLNEDLRRNPFANSSGFYRTPAFEESFSGNRLIGSEKENTSTQYRCFNVMGRTNLHDYDLNKRNNSSILSRSVFHRSRNLQPEENSGLYPEFNRSLNISRTFGPSVNTVDFNSRYNDDDKFKRPYNVRLIRGRNAILPSKPNDLDLRTQYKDLNSINGLDMSFISRKGMDTMSESRPYLNTHSNTLDNQSISGSVLNASIKHHIIGLIENLHQSVLHHIGPRGTVDPVKMEFERVKQMLEKIPETSYTNSIRETDTASMISNSKFIRPPESNISITLDGGCRNLKSPKEIMKTLLLSKSSKNSDSSSSEEEIPDRKKRKKKSSFVFKKPRALVGRKKEAGKSKQSKDIESKLISLKQWYPIATGSQLALCGIDQGGATVKTDPIKKRLNSRKVELTNGMSCNLIGSPSNIISALPKKIMESLKNGLTTQWRVLQKELMNSQTSEDKKSGKKKREGNCLGKEAKECSKEKRKSGKGETSRVISTAKIKAPPLQTRSGRLVKPRTSASKQNGNSMSEEKSSPSKIKTSKTFLKMQNPVKSPNQKKNSPKKRGRKSAEATPKKKEEGSARRQKGKVVDEEESPRKTTKESPSRNSTSPIKRKGTQRKQAKADSSKKTEKIDVDKEVETIMLREEGPKKLRGRKRKLPADSDSIESKKKTRGLTLSNTSRSKSSKTTTPVKKKAGTYKKKTTKEKMETKESEEMEEDFELKLDDIEIPEFSGVCANPQLSRSQLRLVSMETPPLKYFNSNLKLLSSATPVRSPDWCISRRTESEAKQFQKRRVEALKKTKTERITIHTSTATATESKGVSNRDVKKVMEWVAEKTVQSPEWNSKVLQYMIPGRKLLERQQYEKEDEEDEEDGGDCEAGLL